MNLEQGLKSLLGSLIARHLVRPPTHGTCHVATKDVDLQNERVRPS
jgi:hypothetical protein